MLNAKLFDVTGVLSERGVGLRDLLNKSDLSADGQDGSLITRSVLKEK